MLRVLLISPVDPPSPKINNIKYLMGGENTYTQTLLAYPPRGVKYVHITEAINLGEVTYGGWGKAYGWLIKLRIVPLGPGLIDMKIVGHFDVVHVHVHSARISGQVVPVVFSDSSSNKLTLRHYFGWWEIRIKITMWLQAKMFSWLSADSPESAHNLIVWSEFAKRLHGGKGEVIYPGLEQKKAKKAKKDKKEVTIIFIGTWFERKGGRAVIQAYRNLKCKIYNLQLIVVGEVPKDIDLTGIEHYSWLPKSELEKKVFARGDILVHVPPVIEGYGLVVQEAMSWGIPAIVTNIGALPEQVVHGETGLVTKNLVRDLETMIKNKKLRRKMGQAARRRFWSKFAAAKTNQKLRAAYDKVATRHKKSFRQERESHF